MINRIETVTYKDFTFNYHDGKYWTTDVITLQGIEIPKDFYWNGVSCWIDRKDTIVASLLHDYLLLKGYDRKYCDEMFLKQLLEDTTKWRAWTYYRAVRINSWFKGE